MDMLEILPTAEINANEKKNEQLFSGNISIDFDSSDSSNVGIDGLIDELASSGSEFVPSTDEQYSDSTSDADSNDYTVSPIHYVSNLDSIEFNFTKKEKIKNAPISI